MREWLKVSPQTNLASFTLRKIEKLRIKVEQVDFYLT